VRIAVMYDDEALYLSGVWRDPSPMIHREPNLARAADALMIYIQTDVAWEISAWYYTTEQKPLLTMNADTRLNPELAKGFRIQDPLAKGAESAYQKDADGKGYVHELKVPWNLLFQSPQQLKPGARLRMLLDAHWGSGQGTEWIKATSYIDLIAPTFDLSIRFGEWHDPSWQDTSLPIYYYKSSVWGECVLEPQGNLQPQPTSEEEIVERLEGVIPITVSIPASAKKFTIAIDDAAGKRVRNLIENTPVEQYQTGQDGDRRTIEVMWDGLDEHDNPVKPGTYRVKGLTHEGLDVTYLLSYYNPGDPPWQIPDGTGDWGADHTCPTAVACGGRHAYVGWHGTETGCAVLGVDVDTLHKIWHGPEEGWLFGKDELAANSKYLFCADRNSARVARRNADTGEVQKIVSLASMLFTTIELQREVMTLPVTARFKLDPQDSGLKEKWYEKTYFNNWDAIRTDSRWQDQGYHYLGVAWYAIEFDYPTNAPEGPLSFHFGAIDGIADLYMDGRKFAEQKQPPAEMWDKPFSRSLGGGLSPGKHVLVIRVEKHEYSAGVWKPIVITTQLSDGEKIDYEQPTGMEIGFHGVGNIPNVERDYFYQMQGGLQGIAANEELLAASLAGNDRILLVDPDSMEKVGDLLVKSPQSLDFGPDGLLYVVTEGRVLRFKLDTGQRAAVKTPGVGKIGAIAVDDNGYLYVADLGPDMQVKVFDKQGNLVRTAGKKGGRPDEGKFDPQGMRFMSSIDVDANGNIWVCESDDRPRRISVWGKDGRLVKDYIGNTRYHGSGGMLNPTDPTIGYGDGMQFKLDYKTQEWKLVSTMWRQRKDEYFGIWPVYRIHWYCDGGQFITSDASGEEHDYWIDYSCGHTILMREGDHWTPVCAISRVSGGIFDTQGLGVRARGPFVGHENDVCYWFDENRDGKVQEEELEFYPGAPYGSYGHWWDQEVLPDLNLYLANWIGLYRLRPVAWTDYGAPRYDLGHPEFITKSPRHVTVYDDGFISAPMGGSAITGMNKDGEVMWTYPHKYPGWEAGKLEPGDLYKILRVCGVVDMGPEIGKVFSMRAYSHEDFMTTDGLYIGDVFKEIRTAPAQMPDKMPPPGTSINDTSMPSEPFSGWLGRAPDGKVRLLTGAHDWRVCEVLGLDTIKRFGPYELPVNEEDLAAVQQLLDKRAAQAEAEASAAMLTIKRVSPVIDGQLGEWPKDAAALITSPATGEVIANAWVGYDDANLYLAYEVADDSPMINSGKSAPRLFKSGDSVDFQLATNPEADPNRKEPVVGDLRLLISVMNDKPTAVLWRPVVTEGEPKNEVEFTTFQTVKFDDVHTVDTADIKIVRQEHSYTVEAAIPLVELRWQPKSGQQLRGDVGVIFSDLAGTVNVQRVYWANKNTGIIADAPSEAKLHPDLWGQINVE